jgi:hypothetical protein
VEIDERLKKDLGASRRSRQIEDRPVVENREMTEDDRLEMFRMQNFNDALPNIPEIPGYHVCWISTTHQTDTVHRRMRLGYTPVEAHEVPSMGDITVKTGEYAGLIGVNEMLAFKLPSSLYYKFMKESHHDAPLREEGKITDTTDFLREQAERVGSQLVEGDGFQDLRRSAPAPSFRGN